MRVRTYRFSVNKLDGISVRERKLVSGDAAVDHRIRSKTLKGLPGDTVSDLRLV